MAKYPDLIKQLDLHSGLKMVEFRCVYALYMGMLPESKEI